MIPERPKNTCVKVQFKYNKYAIPHPYVNGSCGKMFAFRFIVVYSTSQSGKLRWIYTVIMQDEICWKIMTFYFSESYMFIEAAFAIGNYQIQISF